MTSTIGSAPGRLDLLGGVADYSGALRARGRRPRSPRRCAPSPPTRSSVGPVHAHRRRDRRRSRTLPYPELRAALADRPALDALRARRRAGARPPRRDRTAASPPLGLVRRAASRSACRRARRWRSRPRGRSAPTGSTRSASRRSARRRRTTWSVRPAGSWTRSSWRSGDPARCCRSSADRRRCVPLMPLPDGLEVVGRPTGAEHDVSGAPYRRARAAAFMGKRIVEDAIGARWPWVSELPDRAVADLPEALDGATFLDRWGATDDDVTDRRSRRRRYPVAGGDDDSASRNTGGASRARSTLSDRRRARCARPADGGQPRRATTRWASATPRPPRRSAELLDRAGVHGARSSGGGSGGTVVVVCERGALDDVDALVR